MPRSHLPLVVPALLIAACTDYNVGTSELSTEAESDEMTLGEGESAELTLRLTADAEALAPSPNSWVEITVFAAREESSPVVTVAAAAEVVESLIAGIEYMNLTVDDPLRGCFVGDDGDLLPTPLETSVAADGSCAVSLPVTLDVVGGVVSLHVTAHFELNFGRQNAPGAIEMSVWD